jgi:hypothetical protein
MPPNSDRVFHTPELLLEIFSLLDERTLLTSSQRVNKLWHATIKNSPVLQRKLFIRPTRGQREDKKRVRNPLLVDTFAPWFKPRKIYQQFCSSSEVIESLPLARTGSRLREAFMQPKASWRGMLVTQPPVTKLGCWMEERLDGGYLPYDEVWRFKVLGFPNGLRMGKLYDLAQKWLGTSTRARFRTYWDTQDSVDLSSLFYLKGLPEMYPARDVCVSKVDMILHGERIAGGTLNKAFAKTYEYPHQPSETGLEPATDSGYKTVAQWGREEVPNTVANPCNYTIFSSRVQISTTIFE